MNTNTQMKSDRKVLYSDLSYKIVGSSFNVYNELGWGHKESYYQRALALDFDRAQLRYQKEIDYPVIFNKKIIAKYRIDFIVEDKVVVELKIRAKLGYVQMKQVLAYLKQSGLKLGIIIYFTKDGVKYRRLVY